MEAEARKLETVDEVVDFFVSKTNFWNQKIFDELVDFRKDAAKDRKVLLEDIRELVNSTAVSTEVKFRDFFSSDLILFWRTYHSGDESTRIGDLTFLGWLWKMWPAAWMSGGFFSFVGVLFHKVDRAWAKNFAKRKGLELSGCQKVNKTKLN